MTSSLSFANSPDRSRNTKRRDKSNRVKANSTCTLQINGLFRPWDDKRERLESNPVFENFSPDSRRCRKHIVRVFYESFQSQHLSDRCRRIARKCPLPPNITIYKVRLRVEEEKTVLYVSFENESVTRKIREYFVDDKHFFGNVLDAFFERKLKLDRLMEISESIMIFWAEDDRRKSRDTRSPLARSSESIDSLSSSDVSISKRDSSADKKEESSTKNVTPESTSTATVDVKNEVGWTLKSREKGDIPMVGVKRSDLYETSKSMPPDAIPSKSWVEDEDENPDYEIFAREHFPNSKNGRSDDEGEKKIENPKTNDVADK